MGDFTDIAVAIATILAEHGYIINENENPAHKASDHVSGSFHVRKRDGYLTSDHITIIIWNPSCSATIHKHGGAWATRSIDLANPKAIDQILTAVDELTPLVYTAQ